MGCPLPVLSRGKDDVFLNGVRRFPGSRGNERPRRDQYARRSRQVERKDGSCARLARNGVELHRTALPRPRVLLRVKLYAGLVGGFPRLLERGGEHADNLLQDGVVSRILKGIFPRRGVNDVRKLKIEIGLDIRQTLRDKSSARHPVLLRRHFHPPRRWSGCLQQRSRNAAAPACKRNRSGSRWKKGC